MAFCVASVERVRAFPGSGSLGVAQFVPGRAARLVVRRARLRSTDSTERVGARKVSLEARKLERSMGWVPSLLKYTDRVH